jgi:hypothetical protein
MSKHRPTWKKRPEHDDYTASLNYLSLQFTTATAKRLVKRARQGSKPLSPIILVQGDLTKARPFIIADGYHRLCAACYADEDAPVASVMVEF